MLRLACLVALPVLLVSPASAAVFRAATVEDGARGSDAVVRGVVERVTARYSDDRTHLVTDVEIAVTSVWRGEPRDRVTATIPGGELDGVGEWNDAAPSFTVGEEVVVFLSRRGPRWRVNGLALGKYHVEAGLASPGLEDVEVVGGGQPPAGERLIGPMAVDELEQRVRGAR